jgi:DNA polymerase IV
MPLSQRDGLTMVGVTLSNLVNDDAIQLPLPLDRRASRAVDAVVDQLRDRFGSNALKRASLLGRDEGLLMPLLPEPTER